jgi:hypothetical protein
LISQDLKIYITCLGIVNLIFVIDINLPLGVAGGVPYITVILMTFRATKQSTVIYFAVVCSIMVALGYHFSPAGGEEWKVFFNRSLAIFAVWITAIVVFKWQAQSKKIVAIKNNFAKGKEEIYLATIHSSQHIVNNMLSQLQYIKCVIDAHPEFNKEDVELFDEIVEEGSLLMNKLSSVKNISKESIKISVHPGNQNLTN